MVLIPPPGNSSRLLNSENPSFRTASGMTHHLSGELHLSCSSTSRIARKANNKKNTNKKKNTNNRFQLELTEHQCRLGASLVTTRIEKRPCLPTAPRAPTGQGSPLMPVQHRPSIGGAPGMREGSQERERREKGEGCPDHPALSPSLVR